MKEVNIISTVVQKDQSGKRVPTGNTILIQGGNANVEELKDELSKKFISKTKADTAEKIIEFKEGLSINGIKVESVVLSEDNTDPNDNSVPTTKHVDERYLRKDKDDETKGSLSIQKDLNVGGNTKIGGNTETKGSLGVQKDLNVGGNVDIKGKADIQGGMTTKGDVVIGYEGYAEGLTGFGTKFSRDGSGEMSRLTLRHELRVPKLVFNSIEINVGDKWRGAGGGVIERVEPDYNTDGSMKDTGTIWLQLEEGQIGAVYGNAISQGIFHDFTNKSNNETTDSEIYEDDKMIARTFAGFTTVYFLITEISDYTDENGIVWRNKQCRYQLRPTSTNWTSKAHPYAQMNFVCYGVMSDDEELLEKYGTSAYETRTYTRLLWRQNTWEIGANNIASQNGDLRNLDILGLDAKGYSNYINSVYFTGEIRQVSPNTGEPIKTANDRGEWVKETTYYYYDRVSHGGGLWLCVAKGGTNTEPKEGDAAWLLQVKSGTSVTAEGHWESSKVPYKVNSIVTFADKVWISNKDTSEPPFGIYTDKDINRLIYKDNGYVLVDTLIQSDDWDLLLDAPQLTDGKDGASVQVRYSSDKTNWHDTFKEGDIWMQQRVGDDSLWSDAIRIVGEAGDAGLNGTYYDYQFAVNDSLTIAPATGWQDTPPSVGIGQYLWMRTRFVDPNSSEVNPWSVVRVGGEKGEKGDSITTMGQWKSGMAVPYLGIVTMGGKTFVAKVATSNPPIGVYTDNAGNRLIYKDNGYILEGTENTEEYDLLIQNGKDGSDGKDYEYIYMHTTSDSRPATPNSLQTDDYIPSGWHDDPVGVSETIPYEWVCVRVKREGIWGNYSIPALWAKFGKDGIDGIQGIQGEKGEQGIQGEKGADGLTSYFHIKFADDANGTNMNESGGDYIGTYVDFTQADSTDPKKYTWVKTRGAQGEKGDQGIPGTNGVNGQTSYLHIAYANSSDGKTDFSVSESKDKLYIGQYTDFVIEDSTDPTKYKWTLIKGADGEGFTMMGNWKTGLVVPKMGVVTMKGGSYAAKLATTNPPFWCWTDNIGNRLVFSATEYILTGESNSEYETFAAQGGQGEKGETGEKGEQGEKGDKGDKGDQGAIGYTGCVTRVFQEYSDTQVYRNDTNATPEELDVSGIRYLDMLVLATEDLVNYPSGYVAFECLKTHSGHATTESGYWRAFSSNIASQFVPKLVALDAHLRFASSGQVVILDEKQNPCAGMAGSQEGDKTRIWAGSDNPDNAPFAVNQSGETTASKFRTARNGLRMEAANGIISIFGSLAKNIEFGVNEEGLAVMRYYDNDGTLLYDLGPSGISAVKRENDKWVLKRLTYLGSDADDLFGTYWATAKNPYYSTGVNKYQFLSGYIGGALNDSANNRKMFNSQSKTNVNGTSNVISDGWYCDTLPLNASELNRLQYVAGVLPDDMNESNPIVNTGTPIYVTQAFYVLDGLVFNRMNVYYNLVES